MLALTFINPTILWLGALAAVPLIIYLFNRQRYRIMPWAAMEFVRRALARNRRRLQVENILLLLMRIAAVLLLVAGVARPVGRLISALGDLADKRRHLLIVVDNSYSMGYQQGAQTSLARAKTAATALADGLLRRGDRFALGTMAGEPRFLYPDPVFIDDTQTAGDNQKARVLAEIKELEPSAGTTDAAKTLSGIVAYLKRFQDGSVDAGIAKQVFIITDMQKSAFANDRALKDPSIRKAVQDLEASKAELVLIDCGADDASNAAVTRLDMADEVAGVDIPARFRASVKSFAPAPMSDLSLDISVDDAPQGSRPLALDPGEARDIEFYATFREKGPHRVQVVLKSDNLPADNARFLVVDAKEAVDVVVVDGERKETFGDGASDYFVTALAPAEDSRLARENLIRPRVVYDPSLSDEDLQKASVVVLCNVIALSDEQVEKLETYVRRGGGLLVFLGPQVDRAIWNEKMWKNGKGLLPAPIDRTVLSADEETLYYTLTGETFTHPVLRPFASPEPRELLGMARFSGYMKLEGLDQAHDDPTRSIIARFDPKRQTEKGVEVRAIEGSEASDDPALVEHRFGRGRVLVFTSSADGQWNRFFAQYAYLMLWQRVTTYLADAGTARKNLSVGDVYEQMVPSADYASEVLITTPAKEQVGQEQIEKTLDKVPEEPDRFRLTHADTLRPGFYEVRFGGSASAEATPGAARAAERTDWFAVNVDADEGDLAKIDAAELHALLPELKAQVASDRNMERLVRTPEQSVADNELWRYPLYIALALLIAESVLACYFRKEGGVMSVLALAGWAMGALAESSVVVGHKWLSAPPPWVSFLFVLAIAGLVFVLYRREHSPANAPRRVFLGVLRALAIAAVMLVLYDLVETTTRKEVRQSWVVVMIDDSLSMSLRDRFSDRSIVENLSRATGLSEGEVNEKSRMELVKATLEKDDGAFFKQLLAKNHVKIFTFSSKLVPVAELGGEPPRDPAASTETEPKGATRAAVATGNVLDRVEANGNETAIGDSLNRVLNETRALRVAGIVLLTDGRNNAGALAPLKVAERLHQRGIPLYAVGVGNPEEPKDIALTDLQCLDPVIAGDVVPVRVSVKSQGFEGPDGRLELVAKIDDEVVKTEPIQLQGKGASQDASIRVKIEKPGEYTLSVEIPPQQGELLTDNNRLSKRIHVVDKKIKVLYVDGLPRWEFRYLRWGLIRDHNMEAQTFQVSADPDFVQDASPALAPLAEIPKTKQELFQYHVIILGDVDPHDLGDDRMKLIREFVEDQGGGLLVIAGQHFMPRAYAGTPIEGLLPVSIDPQDDIVTSTHPITESFRPKLTIDGQRHSIMQLENDPEQNLELWGGKRTSGYGSPLPGFYWFYRPREKKRTAEVLAVHPEAQTSKQEPVPIFSLQSAGAGTTFFSATDDVWRWRAGVGDRFTYRFWRQAIRYLSTGRFQRSKRFLITTDKTLYDLGQKVQVTAEVNDRNLRPSEDETQPAFLEAPDGQIERFDMTRPPRTPGRYEAVRPATKVGTYKLWIAAGPNPEKPGPEDELAVRVYQVQVPVLEKSDPKMDDTLLRSMASTKERDRYLTLAEVGTLPDAISAIPDESEVRFPERQLWDRWWVVASIIGLLCVEWAFRKRWKMM